jgi:ribosomal protein L11 methylase PrmA
MSNLEGLTGRFTLKALDNLVLGTIAVDYPWSEIPSSSTVIDIGGGAGSLSVAIAKRSALVYHSRDV